MFKEKVVLSGNLFVMEDLATSMPAPYPYHQHPEYELMYIERAEGKWFIGDKIQDIARQELIMIGPNLPHKWHFERLCPTSQIKVLKWVDISDNPLLINYGGENLAQLWHNTEQGVRITDKRTLNAASAQLLSLNSTHGFNAILSFFQLLHIVLEGTHETICAPGIKSMYSKKEVSRIDRVLNYLQNNYMQEIILEKVANRFHLSKSGFCSFFKKRTGKTFSRYLNDLRVGHACRLLIETEKPVIEIAYDSGYTNISYFNRCFFAQQNVSPRQYRKLHRGEHAA